MDVDLIQRIFSDAHIKDIYFSAWPLDPTADSVMSG